MEVKSELQQRLETVLLSQQEKPSKKCEMCGNSVWQGLYGELTHMTLCMECEDKSRDMLNPESRLYSIGIPRKHKDSSLDNFIGNEKLVDKIRAISEGPPADLLISGPCGCGKTHLVSALIRSMVVAGRLYKKPTKFLSVVDFMLEVKSTFNSRDVTEGDVVKDYSSPILLVLDDLGAEKSSEWAATTIYALIDRRYRDDKKTFITTNLTLEQIEQNLGSRIASRLSEYTIINIAMPDYRKKR